MKTVARGQQAEAAVAKQLARDGFEIIGQNWKTRLCEIDIIARKKSVIHFVEVKFRSKTGQGDGLAYITDQKLRKLRYAADIWNQANSWNGDYRLVAVSVSSNGLDYVIEEIIELE